MYLCNDIGYVNNGIVILDNNLNVLEHTTVKINPKDLIQSNLKLLGDYYSQCKASYNITHVFYEKPIMNGLSGSKLNNVVGILLYLFSNSQIKDVHPLKLKQKITGFGKASKDDMKFHCEKIIKERNLNIDISKWNNHEIDALCIGFYFN